MSVPYNAIVRFQYDPDPENASDDLPLRPDEIITVTEVVDDDWLLGTKTDSEGNTRSGYFPKSFVEPHNDAPPTEEEEVSVSKEEDVHSEPTQPSNDAPGQGRVAPLSPTSITFEDGDKNTNNERAAHQPDLGEIESNIVHEPENFKNKLESFNVSSPPVLPASVPKEESFVKKAFVVDEHRSSYIPPSFGSPKPARKEEKKPDFIAGEIISESTQNDEVEAPRMTLKERMMMLQKQQEEEQKALQAALKRKEERKRTKSHHPHEVEKPDVPQTHNVVDEKHHDVPEPSAAVPPAFQPQAPSADVIAGHMSGSDADELSSNEAEHELSEIESEKEEASVGQDEEEDDAEDDDDEEEDEEDEEELRKRKLAERMAKLSGGMGMMGMMGMMPMAPKPSTKKVKKTKKERKTTEEDAENASPSATPFSPMIPGAMPPIMGMPMPTALLPVEDNEEETDEEKVRAEIVPSAESEVKSLAAPEGHITSTPGEPKEHTAHGAESSEDEMEEDAAELFHDTTEDVPNSSFSAPALETSEPHPYRQQIASPQVPSIPQVESTPLISPTVAPPITRAPPPPPPCDADTSAIPSIPERAPPPLPATSAPLGRPPMPPPTTTILSPNSSTHTVTAPPPVPGTAPQVPVPTQTATISPTHGHPPPPPVPVPTQTATRPSTHGHPPPPPVPAPTPGHLTHSDAISRHSSISSRPPVPHIPTPGIPQRHTFGHSAPPPPPPTDTLPPPVPSTDAVSVSPVVRQLTRTSLDSSSSAMPNFQQDSGSPSSQSELWWTTQSLPPQLKQTENYFEVDATEIMKRNGGTVKYLIYYILDVHLACITLELAYNTSEPERLLFFHETKEKLKHDSSELIEQYTKYGPLAYNTAVRNLNKSVTGEFIDFIFSNLPQSVLRPIANKTFGAVVYRNNNGEAKVLDDIRPGDVLVQVNAEYDSNSVPKVGFKAPHVSLVTSFDTEKNKIKVIEQTNGTIQQGRYKLNKLKSGKLRVFRIVDRSFVGW